MTLDEIWIKIRNNDTVAFGQLFHRFYPGMCQYASQLLNDKYTAEEVVQDIFLRVWEKRSEITSHNGSLKKYMYRLVHNLCIDTLRKYNTRKEELVQFLPLEAWTKISEKYGFDEFLIEQLETEDIIAKIQQIVAQLPTQCREIFIKSRFENQSNREIAFEMKLSEHTIKAQIYRALQKIKKYLYLFLILFLKFL
jgi:RNA polymerase sigma-70 factor (ECF subfamily)